MIVVIVAKVVGIGVSLSISVGCAASQYILLDIDLAADTASKRRSLSNRARST